MKEIKNTSEIWQALRPNTFIVDRDGWPEENFEYSWYTELITENEYFKRLSSSTIRMCKNPKVILNKNNELLVIPD